MYHDEVYKKAVQDFMKIREDWIMHSIRCNIDEDYVILDFQQFIEDNNIKLVFNPRIEYTELRMNGEVIGKFNERPEIIQEGDSFRFIIEHWTKNDRSETKL